LIPHRHPISPQWRMKRLWTGVRTSFAASVISA
jgi:hypothetical protein